MAADSQLREELQREYERFLRGREVPMACQYCGEDVMPKVYERHCRARHGVDPNKMCVWCRGEVVWWRRRNVDHVYRCSRKLLATLQTEPTTTTATFSTPATASTPTTEPATDPFFVIPSRPVKIGRRPDIDRNRIVPKRLFT